MYAECFHDNLAFAAALFACSRALPPSAQTSQALTEPTALWPLLARHGRAHGAAEPRAIASQWSKYVFARLIIPTVVLQCSLDRAVDFTATRWGFSLEDDATPAVVHFCDDPLGATGTGADFGSLIDDAIMPLIGALRAAAGLSPRVYASNAAMYYAWALDQLGGQARGQPGPLGRARALLTTPARIDGGFNPFHAPHRAVPPGTHDGDGQCVDHCRRLCCVRDLDPAWGLCANCPRAMQYPARQTLRPAAAGPA